MSIKATLSNLKSIENFNRFCFFGLRYAILILMSVLRYISILMLSTVITFQSSFLTVSALTDEDIAVNSIEDLQLPAAVLDETETE